MVKERARSETTWVALKSPRKEDRELRMMLDFGIRIEAVTQEL